MAEDLEKAHTPHQRETRLADDYLKSATLARDVAHKALQRTLQDLEAGTLRDPAKAAVNAATAGGIMLDKRLILEGRPTQIVQTDDPKRAAQALARRLGVALDTTANDIETPALPAAHNESLPLLSESVASKRARVREAKAAD
jgi:hypothetical protein